LILEAIEKIEITARSAISNSVAARHGPHWYTNVALFAKPNYFHQKTPFNVAQWHADFIADVKRQIGHDDERRRDVFIKHYYDTYSQPDTPPCWMVFEVLNFGSISHCFKFLRQTECKEVCRRFALNHQVLSSWLHSVSYVRNLCAHQARVWNRVLTIKPIIPNARRVAFNNQNDRIYAALLAIQLMLRKVWGTNHWAEALKSLVEEHPRVPLAPMGFPADWAEGADWGL
jgi:abortive infection bacteriophage resistance protein